MQLSASTAEKLIAELGMPDIPLMELEPKPALVSSDWFTRYKSLCREFMTSLVDSAETLAFMNLSQDEFMNLVMGKSLPSNLSFRLRVPLVWGGKLEIDNMFMCWTFPHSMRLDKFIIMQSDAKTLWLPNPAKKIYLPAHTTGGGDGGNATEDRLAQMAAQLAAERD